MKTTCILLVLSGLLLGGLGVDARAQPEGGGVLGDFLASGSLFTPRGPTAKEQPARIIRTDFDLTGDGAPEVFLSWPDTWMKNGFLWVVYEVTGESSLYKLGAVRFNDNYVRVTEPGSLRVLEGRQVGLYWLVDYDVLSGKLTEVDRQELSDADESERRTVEKEMAAMRRFWQEHEIPSAWAALSDGTLTPWKSSVTHEVLPDLVPIAPGFRLTPLASDRPERGDLSEHLQEHQPCGTPGCGIYLELRDVTGDGEPELLLRTSSASPHLVYSRVPGGLRFLGELPLGFWRLDEDGRLLLLRRDSKALEIYRVTSEGIVHLDSVPATSDRERVESERQRMALQHMERQSGEYWFQALWEQATAHPSDVQWVTLPTREPATVGLALSTPVNEPQAKDSTER